MFDEICTHCGRREGAHLGGNKCTLNSPFTFKPKKKDCDHKRIRMMRWPDGGDSEVCEDCLLTRHIDCEMTTEWQDHIYDTVADWYGEAMRFQLHLNNI